ncbi:MAG: thiamine phosphate synthase [Candidatus Omnitrophica bacterium]|nr:thiamine phosphate synthase [Candidatus Omnitrophota bacterium]
MRKKLLKNCRLYLVLDKKAAGTKDLISLARLAIEGGIDILQLRWKDKKNRIVLKVGKELRKVTKEANVLFIIDDNIDLANTLDADGVHLGQEDLPIKKGRAILGSEKIIGCSTHTISQAKKAVSEGADYISVGPIFKTPIKADYKAVGLKFFKRVRQETELPVFGIGGIGLNNVKEVIKSGADRVAVVRAIVNATDPKMNAARLKEELNKT